MERAVKLLLSTSAISLVIGGVDSIQFGIMSSPDEQINDRGNSMSNHELTLLNNGSSTTPNDKAITPNINGSNKNLKTDNVLNSHETGTTNDEKEKDMEKAPDTNESGKSLNTDDKSQEDQIESTNKEEKKNNIIEEEQIVTTTVKGMEKDETEFGGNGTDLNGKNVMNRDPVNDKHDSDDQKIGIDQRIKKFNHSIVQNNLSSSVQTDKKVAEMDNKDNLSLNDLENGRNMGNSTNSLRNNTRNSKEVETNNTQVREISTTNKEKENTIPKQIDIMKSQNNTITNSSATRSKNEMEDEITNEHNKQLSIGSTNKENSLKVNETESHNAKLEGMNKEMANKTSSSGVAYFGEQTKTNSSGDERSEVVKKDERRNSVERVDVTGKLPSPRENNTLSKSISIDGEGNQKLETVQKLLIASLSNSNRQKEQEKQYTGMSQNQNIEHSNTSNSNQEKKDEMKKKKDEGNENGENERREDLREYGNTNDGKISQYEVKSLSTGDENEIAQLLPEQGNNNTFRTSINAKENITYKNENLDEPISNGINTHTNNELVSIISTDDNSPLRNGIDTSMTEPTTGIGIENGRNEMAITASTSKPEAQTNSLNGQNNFQTQGQTDLEHHNPNSLPPESFDTPNNYKMRSIKEFMKQRVNIQVELNKIETTENAQIRYDVNLWRSKVTLKNS